MRFEKTTLEAIRFRAAASGENYMTIEAVTLDLGGPADFEEVLSTLQARGAITLHPEARALSLRERGRQSH